MRLFLVFCGILAATGSAEGYSIKDGSGGDINAGILSTLADMFSDPDAVQFRRLRVGNDALCGEINAKNAFGAYVGFQPFFEMHYASIAPGSLGLGQSSPVCD